MILFLPHETSATFFTFFVTYANFKKNKKLIHLQQPDPTFIPKFGEKDEGFQPLFHLFAVLTYYQRQFMEIVH